MINKQKRKQNKFMMADESNYKTLIENVSKHIGEEQTNILVDIVDSIRNSKTHEPLNYEQKCLLLYIMYKSI